MGLEMLDRLCGGEMNPIDSAHNDIAKISNDPEDNAWFRKNNFDIPLMNQGKEKFQARICKSVKTRCAKKGEILGLGMNKIAILAIMAAFMNVRFIPSRYKVEMGTTLFNFGKWVRERAAKAEELEKRVQERLSTQKSEPEIALSFEDVLKGRL